MNNILIAAHISSRAFKLDKGQCVVAISRDQGDSRCDTLNFPPKNVTDIPFAADIVANTKLSIETGTRETKERQRMVFVSTLRRISNVSELHGLKTKTTLKRLKYVRADASMCVVSVCDLIQNYCITKCGLRPNGDNWCWNIAGDAHRKLLIINFHQRTFSPIFSFRSTARCTCIYRCGLRHTCSSIVNEIQIPSLCMAQWPICLNGWQ